MFGIIKNNLAHFIIKRKYAKKNPPVLTFNNFFTKSAYYFVLMPYDEKDFTNALNILKFFDTNKKNVTIFLQHYKVNLIPSKTRFKFITYDESDLARLNLPKPSLVKRLKKKTFDVVIDLNLQENVLTSAVSNLVDANFRIGFQKRNSDKYYNLLYMNDQSNSEISYKNLLASLQMF
ncbi:MAG: hypothetical protein A2V66_15005 [Ignavibacteria bacterium RBG_13_36_8]|nr:MAG: hypothetical protein A2V66_15005 [Ignavibacteria bacterium RBG_13_36_8]